MPANSNRTTLARMWEMLQMLPVSGPGITAAELQTRLVEAGHKTSKRTVERDLNELSRVFPLHCNDKGMPYGWLWMDGRSLNVPGMSINEALALMLIESSIRPLMPQFMLSGLEARFTQAQQKLEALSEKNASARWPQYIASVIPHTTLLPPQINPDTLATIQNALLEQKQLTVQYASSHKQQIKSLTLNPAALVQRGHTTYLLASSNGFQDVRQYALHRFNAAQALHTPSQIPESFVLSEYIEQKTMQFGHRGTIRLEAWVSAQIADLLTETPLSEDMQLSPCADQSGYAVTARVADTWELRWWLLSHAGSVVVSHPKGLREELKERLERAARQYRD